MSQAVCADIMLQFTPDELDKFIAGLQYMRGYAPGSYQHIIGGPSRLEGQVDGAKPETRVVFEMIQSRS